MINETVSAPIERENVKQDVFSPEKSPKREKFQSLTSIINSAIKNNSSVQVILFNANDAVNEPDHHADDKQNVTITSTDEERFVPSNKESINTEKGSDDCGLAKWYWACLHFDSWNENIF